MSFKRIMIVALLGTAAFVPAVHAGFFLEGLQPYAGNYCRDADPAVSDPVVAPQAFDWEKSSPDASTLGGRPAYVAQNCKGGGKFTPGAGRVLKPLNPQIGVPQK